MNHLVEIKLVPCPDAGLHVDPEIGLESAELLHDRLYVVGTDAARVPVPLAGEWRGPLVRLHTPLS